MPDPAAPGNGAETQRYRPHVADADPWIAALRACHHTLASAVAGLDHRALTRPSFCNDWDISCVLGHLGSGAEIGLGGLDAARAGTDPPVRETFPTIWARWDSMSPEARRDCFLDVDEQLVAAYEALDDATRTALAIKLGFLPHPLDVETIVGFRLSELALHSWDVRVTTDPVATLDPVAVELLVDGLPQAAGFMGRGELAPAPATVGITTRDPARQFTLVVGDSVSLEPGPPGTSDATLALPAETLVRLIAGRLPDRAPAVTFDSATLHLADVRGIFRGL